MKSLILRKNNIFIISILIIFIDQISKNWAVNHFLYKGSSVLIPKLIEIRYIENTGAAFGILNEFTFVLGIISLIFSISLILWISSHSPLRLWQGIAIGCILGGSIGNGIDRWRLGYVIDFINFVPIQFPVFNASDIAINIGVLFLIMDIIGKKNEY